jgi:hypothetical protein
MLSEFSLRALIDISKSRFSSSLTYLIIGLDRPPPLRFGYTNPDKQNAWAHAHADYGERPSPSNRVKHTNCSM